MILKDSAQESLWPGGDASEHRKRAGAYYTPDPVVRTLVNWAVRKSTDRLLDPACGDGRFLVAHTNSVGVEQDAWACSVVHARSPGSLIHQGDFFAWAGETRERFECAAGNPPFIRYQRFSGKVREAAQRLCAKHGASFSSLSSSWAPFLVAAATLLKPGGRLAFVVPAEIGHAPYAAPVLEFLTKNFGTVQIVAIREKLFPGLSEDCWLLFASGLGDATQSIRLTMLERFEHMASPPRADLHIGMDEWRQWNGRLRSFLMPAEVRELYLRQSRSPRARRLADVARVGIGYVSGANDFFHLHPSQCSRLRIPQPLLHPTVRSGRNLSGGCVDQRRVRTWLEADEAVLLLKLDRAKPLPQTVVRYLASEAGKEASRSYKCRNRDPWYVVPDVTVPDGFLSYMSGSTPVLAGNPAGCVCTNSVHAVHLTGSLSMSQLLKKWRNPLTVLSCEIEGHPLGGGMLKLEPREAARILLSEGCDFKGAEASVLEAGLTTMRRWRHHAE